MLAASQAPEDLSPVFTGGGSGTSELRACFVHELALRQAPFDAIPAIQAPIGEGCTGDLTRAITLAVLGAVAGKLGFYLNDKYGKKGEWLVVAFTDAQGLKAEVTW